MSVTPTPTETAATAYEPDPRPQLARALDQAGRLIDGTDPAQGSLPTPCADFDVAAVVGHLLGVVRRIGVVLDGRPFYEAPSHLDSTDWSADWATGRAGTEQVLADAGNLSRTVTVPWGEELGADVLASYVGEMTVHSWDIAVATGRLEQLDPELATVALSTYRRKVPAEPRGGQIPFGPVVPVSDDAAPYARLVGWTGRDPQWVAG
ncbi:TIGR03086 family metal-binding protein [Nakamurella lactea]|uniref:TIGR03086 family metal-binding protein n=1 Tax=Nakamurella lactea TaxID=459515 RepID=UPI0003FFC4E2|nr:TIGR03086 family metal-binding protein [Nakamurella lactea]